MLGLVAALEYIVLLSESPLVFDTLPALKVRHYRGASRAGNIYTYARCYWLKEDLQVGLYVFEREAPPESRVQFALGPGGASPACLLATADADGVQLQLHPGADGGSPVSVPFTRFAGTDEQGWFWGVQFSLEAAVLAGAGIAAPLSAGPPPDEAPAFVAAVLKTRSDEAAIGASFPLAAGADPLNPALFHRCRTVRL